MGMDTTEAILGYRGWWADVANRHSPSTARTYRAIVARTLAEIPPDRIDDPASIRRYLDEMRTNHASVARSALRDLYGYLIRSGRISHDPLATVRTARRKGKRVRRALEPDELVRLLVALVYIGVGKTRWTGEHIAWAVLAQYATGMRPGELIDLRVDDLRLNGDSSAVYLTNTKTGNDRIVPLNATARIALGELAAGRRGRVLTIGRTQYWSHVRRAALAAGIDPERARPYALRHSFATHLIERGVHQRFVADLLGHVDMRHVWSYTVPSQDALRSAAATLDLTL